MIKHVKINFIVSSHVDPTDHISTRKDFLNQVVRTNESSTSCSCEPDRQHVPRTFSILEGSWKCVSGLNLKIRSMTLRIFDPSYENFSPISAFFSTMLILTWSRSSTGSLCRGIDAPASYLRAYMSKYGGQVASRNFK